MQPQNFGQFDIDRYYITVNSTSGAQHLTTACGQCTNNVITVSDDRNNMQMETTFTVTISARNLCGETGPTATASYTLSKLLLVMLDHICHVLKHPYEIYLLRPVTLLRPCETEQA